MNEDRKGKIPSSGRSVNMTDEGVGREKEDKEGNEKIRGEQGEGRCGVMRVEDTLETEESEGLFGDSVNLDVSGQDKRYSEEYGGV